MNFQQYFKNLILSGRLSHAYLLWGYGGGDQKLAYALSVAELFERPPFIDCLVVRPAAGTIGIDAVRDVIRFIWQKPVRSERKTVIIVDAAALTTEAQNAFLKVVEEPPEHGLILCIVRDPSLLVPALQSRFQKIYIPSAISHFSNFADASLGKQFPAPHKVLQFLNFPMREKKEMIKKLVEKETENPGGIAEFVAGLIAELDKDPIKNYDVLRSLIERWTLMNQLNVNKRLQLEAVFI